MLVSPVPARDSLFPCLYCPLTRTRRVQVDQSLGRLAKLVQHLKVIGLQGGEAHRLDQYVSKVRNLVKKGGGNLVNKGGKETS